VQNTLSWVAVVAVVVRARPTVVVAVVVLVE
jgi:hypothetical protein